MNEELRAAADRLVDALDRLGYHGEDTESCLNDDCEFCFAEAAIRDYRQAVVLHGC